MRAHVQAGRLSDAFALGQHILRYYPKHIETYVVLAQASLEANDMAGATDLFRRVLSADPENVLALAGMALIHEMQDRSDEALWYLERAYEIQPGNDDLRRELVRLREMYYGAVTERLELTPGALARIYARQGQYAPAVNEFRRLLRHEGKRYDARVALAEALYRAGRADEAAQLAQNIMQDAPYSLKPNLILGVLWSENSVPEGKEYLARAQAMDPECRVARDLIGAGFADMPPPRLPSLDAKTAGAPQGDQPIGLAYAEPAASSFAADADTFASEIEPFDAAQDIDELQVSAPESAHETGGPPLAAAAIGTIAAAEMLSARETARADASPVPGTAQVETAPTGESTVHDAGLAAAAPADATTWVAEASTMPDTIPAEIAAAQEQSASLPPPVRADASPAPRARSKSDSIPTDAIAAAAAALATSIAVDKSKQPAPARRTHPALPKVRPVIGGASDKLPGWLRLSATPSQASASFDAPAPTKAEHIAPIVTPETNPAQDNRPDWLVQAQASTSGQAADAPDTELPAWLRSAAVLSQAQNLVTSPSPETLSGVPAGDSIKAAESPLPDWLRDSNQTKVQAAAVSTAATDEPKSEIPAWLQDAPVQASGAPTADSLSDTKGTADVMQEPVRAGEPGTGVTNELPPPLTGTGSTQGIASPPPAVPEATESVSPEPAAAPEKPADARALIDTARVKRDNGDLKGALDSYERAMHRRPNHLEEIVGDLQELMKQPDTPATVHRLLGEAYAMTGRYKESLEQYRLAMGK